MKMDHPKNMFLLASQGFHTCGSVNTCFIDKGEQTIMLDLQYPHIYTVKPV